MKGIDSVGRALDMGLEGYLFETHRFHCVVSLSKTLYLLLSTGSTQEDKKSSRHVWKIVVRLGYKASTQTKQIEGLNK